MSILIKGMKMPENCLMCQFHGFGGYKNEFIVCSLTGRSEGQLSNVPDCPLVEVPTPHGRLIDEKQIPYIDLNADMPQSKVRVWTTFKDKIDRLPTIIEAEGETHEHTH